MSPNLKRILLALAATCSFLTVTVNTLPPVDGPNSAVYFSIYELSGSVDLFALENGRLPTDEEGLNVLIFKPDHDADKWLGPYLRTPRVPVDPWDTPFVYRRTTKSAQGYVIYSSGPNRLDDQGREDDIAIRTEDDSCFFFCRDRTFQWYMFFLSLAGSIVSFVCLLYFVVVFGYRKLSK